MKKALVLLDREIEKNNIDALPVANVHDEFQYQVKKIKAEQLGQLAVQSITNAGKELNIRCPLTGSIKLETTGKKHTKTLDTLVPDINNLLTNLGDGKKLKVSDEQLNKFLSNIKDAIVDWTNPVKQDRSSLRMSILGRPLRQLWYDKHKPIRRKIKSFFTIKVFVWTYT